MNTAIRIHRGVPDEVEAAAVAVISAQVAAAGEVVEDAEPERSA